MKSILPLAVALLGAAIPGAALAGANKTWVSGNGVDSGSCTITAPCKSFQYAHDQTSSGGEIDVKDSGGYGTLVISKPISIIADGVAATISVPAGGTGISVQAAYDDHVLIRGVTIDGHGLGNTNGIVVNSPTTIEKSAIHNVGNGVNVTATATYASLKDDSITGCPTGVYTVGRVFLSGNHFGMGGFGVWIVNGTAYSYGDNVFDTDTAGAFVGANPISLPKQ